MLVAAKHVVVDSFVFQQHSAPVHGVRNTGQLPQHKILSFILHELYQSITKFTEFYGRVTCKSTRLKKSNSDWLNSGTAVMQHLSEKKRFSCVLPGSAEAPVAFLPKIYQNWSMCVKLVASQTFL